MHAIIAISEVASKPLLADNRDQDVAGFYGFLDRLNEVLTISDAIEINENFVLRKVL
jgi:hypothetical protein